MIRDLWDDFVDGVITLGFYTLMGLVYLLAYVVAPIATAAIGAYLAILLAAEAGVL